MSRAKRKPVADNAAQKQLEAFCFQPGQSGNPKGRPKGSRNKLGEDFIADLQAHWEKEGPEVIKRVCNDRPDIFLKVVASLMPKEANITQQPNVSEKFLKLLDSIEERGKLEQREKRQLLIDRANAMDVEPDPLAT
jgi:Family of unknown function (DUF5681)